jgi:hypothetical protein
MADYLEESAAALRLARKRAEGIICDPVRAGDLLLRVADGFARIEALKQGLLPAELIPGGVAGEVGEREHPGTFSTT